MTQSARRLPHEETPDNKPAIDQVRDLLFGEAEREHSTRIAELELLIKSMDGRITEQLRAMQARMEAMSQAPPSKHEDSLRQIGEALVSIGRQLSALGSAHEHDRYRNA
jgi:hypothetical protein